MKSLIIDSATKKLYIALVFDDEVVYEFYQDGKNDHSKYIVSLIEEGLKKNSITVENLDKIIVGIGPGSYTGVRMGITIAKMFNAFKEIPVYEISTLYLMGSSKEDIASVKIDARRGNVFGMIYDYKKENYIKEEALYKNEEIEMGEIITEENFIVLPQRCIEHAKIVENVDTLIPNYLRDTEAERNLNDKTSSK